MGKRLYTWLLLSLGVVTGALAQSMIITGGNDHGLALCNKGQIFAWGYNDGNRLCLADPADAAKSIVPSPSLVNTGGLTFSLLCGGSGGHSVALSCFNTVYCWGDNSKMQCGRPVGTDWNSPKYIEGGVPVPVYKGETTPGYNLDGTEGGDYLGNVKYIAATSAASFAILNDGKGRAVMWGGNVTGGQSGGGVIENPTYEPVYVRDANGQPIENVIHIAGGDNNVLLIVGDSPDAKVGTVYSIGNWNGRGGGAKETSYIAAPVEIGDGTGQKSSKKHLTGVRTAGVGDCVGFAVEGSTGNVYAWGHGSWGCMNGIKNNVDTYYAEKVSSGQYKQYSNEAYLTDVTQVIGGNGNGTAITKEGYVLYWGVNQTSNSGGVVPNSTYASQSDMCATGPVFANYCKGEKGNSEVRVDDAVAIARGDLYGFMVNKEGDFYVWGSTARPGDETPIDVGTLGIGKEKYISTCFTKIVINCDPQDLCPEAFMVGPRKKCPGTSTSLYSGFTPLLGRGDFYFFQWSKKNGAVWEVMNESKQTDPVSVRSSDKYNKESIDVDEPGQYRVDIFYVGDLVPCDNCPETYAEIEVVDMEMPIDTIMTQACVSDPPSASNVIPYEFKVNDKFYKSGENTTWVVYDKEQNGTPLDTLDVKVGDKGGFSVKGNVVKVNDNAPIDTTYSIWIEDATKKSELFLKNKNIVDSTVTLTHPTFADMSEQAPCFFTFETTSDFSLGTFSLVLKGNGQAVSNLVVTASVYSTDLCEAGNVTYSANKKLTSISKSIPSLDTVPKVITMDFKGFSAPVNKVRGTSYIIVVSVNKQVKALVQNATAGTSIFSGSIKLIDGGLDYKSEPECYSNNDYKFSIHNLEFVKLTDYTCGRIELQCRLYCPPCTSPDEVKMLVDGVAKTSDTISLCEESPEVELSVEDIKSTQNSSAAFDVLWFVDQLGAETDAAQVDKKAAASTYKTKIKWSAAKEGTTEKYYVRGRDNENPSDSHCFAEDSVVVKYNKKPVVPTIEIPSFCKGLVDDAVKSYLNNDLKTLLNGLKADILDPSNAPVAVADLATSLNALAAGTQTYKISVTDLATGCISEVSSFEVEVKAIPDKPSIENLDFVVSDVTDQSVKAGATAATGADLHWYSKKSDFPANPSTTVPTVSLKDEATFTFWVSQNVDGCESDTASFLVTVNDAPVPSARDTAICVQNSLTNPTPTVDLSTLVEAGDPKNPNTAFTLNWYTDANAAKKTGSATPPSVDYTKVGVQTFYVSQTNSETDAESNKKAVSVMIYTAHQLSPVSPDTYCDEEQNPRALEKFAEDGSTDYEKASDIQWYLYGDAWDKDKLPVLGIEKDTTYIFGAVQSYTITSATGKELETCYSDTTYYTVNVLYTPPTGDSSVAYIAAEVGSDNKTFPAITTKEGWSEEPGYTYYYSEAGKNNFSKSVPKPVCDVSNLNGSTTTILYDVYRVKDGASIDCPSEVKTISVSISDAMPPKVKDYHYCEGSELQPISAEIRPISGKTENSYELYWYTSKPSSTTTTPDKTGTTYSLSGTAAVESDGSIKSTTYYVAQHDVETGATSAAVEIHVVVYPKPILTITDPAATCGSDNKFVDITGTWKASNTNETVTPTYSA
ncbi:MAG: hypothetical protein J6U08_04755, partial [Paludibacteraceae bacterium]|nr:hypothetical protein [Paludibacteraceae bacterium]